MKIVLAVISVVFALMLANAGIDMIARATWTGPLFAGTVILGVLAAIVVLTIEVLRAP